MNQKNQNGQLLMPMAMAYELKWTVLINIICKGKAIQIPIHSL